MFREPLSIFIQDEGVAVAAAIRQLHGQQVAQDRSAFALAGPVQVVLDPWLLTRLPGSLEAVARFLDAQDSRPRPGSPTLGGYVAHEALGAAQG